MTSLHTILMMFLIQSIPLLSAKHTIFSFPLRGGGGISNTHTHTQKHPSRKKTKKKKHDDQRSILTLQRSIPTEQDVRQLFDGTTKPSFNHEFVGITNPCLHTPLLDNNNNHDYNNDYNNDKNENDDIDDLNGKGWIPDGLPTSHLQSNSHHRPTRILRYRRKVGTGVECYTKLRDIALQWEGLHQHSHWAGVKLLPPPSSTLSTPLSPLPSSLSSNLHQIFSDPGGRTLITYSRIGPSRYSPVWAMNPCGVVYDIVDDHSQTMMYSSTAYATLRGHWLAGEERVTVAMDECPNEYHPSSDDHVLFAQYANRKNDGIDGGRHPGRREGDVYIEILSCSRPAPHLWGKLIFPFVKGMQDRFFREEMDTLERMAKRMD